MVNPDDIAAALGRPTPASSSAEYAQWTYWISGAELLIKAEAARRGTTVAALDDATVTYVVTEAVKAQVLHPDDATQVTVSVDDGSTSRSYRSGTGGVSIRAEWWGLLWPSLASDSFTITPAAEPDPATPGALAWL